ncbi:MAG TPA: hypothetical protein VIG64_13020 [Actinomycetota bacterium]
MIETQMVRRMAIRGAYLAPVVVGVLGAWGGWSWALSAAVGLAMTIGNLWLSARLIGGVAENSPHLLMPVALATFTLGLLLLTGAAIGLKAIDAIYFPVTGFVLIGSHLLLVLVEAAGAYDKAAPSELTRVKGNVRGRA